MLLATAPPADAARRAKDLQEPMIVLQSRELARQERLEGLALLEDYLEGDPKPELAPWVILNAGEQRRLINDLKGAREHFEQLRSGYPDHPLHDAAVLGITMVDAGEHPSGNQLATMGLLTAEGAPASLDADRYRLLALATTAEGDRPKQQRSHVAKANAYAEESGDPLVQARLSKSLARIANPAMAAMEPDHGVDPDQLASQSLERAHQAMAEGDADGARRAAESFLATFPESPAVREAEYLIQRAERGDPYDERLVGVLLPLSGTYAPPGQRLQRVIEMANRHAGSPMRLVFVDTQGEPERSVELLEELVLERGAAVVMGPLLKESASVAAETAQALHVPLVTLSQAEDITTDRPFVFRGFLTPAQQVEALMEHVMGTMDLVRFAVLAPDTSYGHVAAEAFTAAAAQRGGSVLKTVYYDPAAGDFRGPAAELADKDYKARAWEFHKLKEDAEERGMDPDKVVLPPRVEYQAIFIPDAHQRVPLVVSALAYEEFAIGAFKPKRDDVPLVMLGLNGWHHDQLAVDGGKYVRDGILVDAFDLDDPSIQVESFAGAFQQEFDRDPGVVDAMAYDAARMVAATVVDSPGHREQARDALAAVELPDTVSCGRSFDEQGEVQRELLVLTVFEETIGLWEPEPEEGAEPLDDAHAQ